MRCFPTSQARPTLERVYLFWTQRASNPSTHQYVRSGGGVLPLQPVLWSAASCSVSSGQRAQLSPVCLTAECKSLAGPSICTPSARCPTRKAFLIFVWLSMSTQSLLSFRKTCTIRPARPATGTRQSQRYSWYQKQKASEAVRGKSQAKSRLRCRNGREIRKRGRYQIRIKRPSPA